MCLADLVWQALPPLPPSLVTGGLQFVQAPNKYICAHCAVVVLCHAHNLCNSSDPGHHVQGDTLKTAEGKSLGSSGRATVAEKTRWKVVNQKGAQLHLEPEATSEVVGQAKGFQIVTADDERNGWVHVVSPMFGWVQIRGDDGANLLKMGKMLAG